MSYSIKYTNEKGECFKLDKKHTEGGTYVDGGTYDTELNITYNYSWYYYLFLDKEKGIRWLYGKKGKDCIEKLNQAIEPFKEELPYEHDYWANTPGNCVKPLRILLSWAEQFPEGVFSGD